MSKEERARFLNELGLKNGQLVPEAEKCVLGKSGWHLGDGQYLGQGNTSEVDLVGVAVALRKMESDQVFCIIPNSPEGDVRPEFIWANGMIFIKRGEIYSIDREISPPEEIIHEEVYHVVIPRQGVRYIFTPKSVPAPVGHQIALSLG